MPRNELRWKRTSRQQQQQQQHAGGGRRRSWILVQNEEDNHDTNVTDIDAWFGSSSRQLNEDEIVRREKEEEVSFHGRHLMMQSSSQAMLCSHGTGEWLLHLGSVTQVAMYLYVSVCLCLCLSVCACLCCCYSSVERADPWTWVLLKKFP